MTIEIECPKCHRTYQVASKIIGQKVICATKACGRKFIAVQQIEEVDFLHDDNPKRVKKKSQGGIVRITVTVVTVVPLIIGAIGIVRFLEYRQSNIKKRETRAALLRQGVSDDAINSLNSETPVQSDPERDQMVALLGFADATLRLIKVTDNAELAREYIVKWAAMRTLLQRSDQAETSLGVIEGHLNAIHKKLYPRKIKRSYDETFGWRDATEWSYNKDSEESIRIAESQLMRSFKIPWKEIQAPSTFRSKYAQLQRVCKTIVAASKPLSSGLPKPLAADEASKLVRELEILYADIPFFTQLPSGFIQEQADLYEFPFFGDNYLTERMESERHCFDLATKVIYLRSQMPTFEDSLRGKTEALKFSESYVRTLEYLASAADR